MLRFALSMMLVFSLQASAGIVESGKWLSASTYYAIVTTQASSEQSARSQAFQLAIEHAVGSVVLNEKTVRNKTVTQNDLLSYSSGRVTKFNYLKNSTIDGFTTLTLEIWVSRSPIADRIQQSQPGTKISRIGAILKDAKTQTTKANEMITGVFDDYPKNAYTVSTNVAYNIDAHEPILIVNYVIVWNKAYIDAIEDVLAIVSNNNRSGPGVSLTRSCLFCQDFYGLTNKQIQLLTDLTYYKQPVMKVTFLDAVQQPLQTQCLVNAPLQGVDFESNFLTIGYNNTLNVTADLASSGSLKYDIHSFPESADSIAIEVVDKNSCIY
jgi:hypothetical protein